MAVTAIVGANWGDEGKGKMTDVLAAQSSYVVRYQGGSNAGHTIINDFGKFALHMLPSGVFNPNVMNIIGPGVALDIDVLSEELRALTSRGVPFPQLMISDRAQMVLPIHKLFDQLEEERLGKNSFGSTRQGIAPFYADKYMKLGIQASDLLDPARLSERIERLLETKNVLLEHFYGQSPIEADEWMPQLRKQAEFLAPYIGDTTALLQKAYMNGLNILLEGQLGALRDPDHGVYPFTTSSSTLAGFASVGAGLPPYAITEVIAVTKAYSSCVGAGPFVSELDGAEAEALRQRGGDAGEYGVTTGRPRRVGWFDAVATRYGCRLQGATSVVLTNLDVLGYLDEISVCIGYEMEDGITDQFPITSRLASAKPVFKQLPGWKCDISGIKNYEELPVEARQYVEFMESELGVVIGTVSVGPRRDQVITR